MSAAAQRAFALPQLNLKSGASAFIVLADAVAVEAALLLACAARLLLSPVFPARLGFAHYAGLAAGVLILPAAYAWFGLYPGYGLGAVQRLKGRMQATFLVFSILLAWNYLFEEKRWSLGVLFTTMLFALAIPPLFEAVTRSALIARGMFGQPVVILGAGKTGAMVARRLQKERDLGLIPVAILDDDARLWGEEIAGLRVAGPLATVSAYQRRAKLAIVAMPEMQRDRIVNLVEHLLFSNVIVVPDLFGLQTLWTMSRDLGGVLGLELRKNLLLWKNRVLKRALDYCLAGPGFVFSIPIIAVSAIWIKIVSPGPAFFRQEREGEHGETIRVWKMRTMYQNADNLLADYLEKNPEEKADWLRFYKLKNDPRVLPGIGKFLRRSSFDELPQLWNVLRGDMSLVGPRPFPYYHLNSFPQAFRALRSSVSPGLTGLWQVSERSDGDLSVQEAQDTYYIRNWSLWLDLYILLCTVRTVLFPRGAY